MAVPESEDVCNAVTEWAWLWRRHGWRTCSGEVGHWDSWEQLPRLHERAGEEVPSRWVPSLLDAKGKEHADGLALPGLLEHPNDVLPL